MSAERGTPGLTRAVDLGVGWCWDSFQAWEKHIMQIRNLFNKEDRAVSPVIGVILMVAITVILAAVIGTFVLGLGDNVQQNAQAGVTFSQSDNPSGDDNDVTISVNSIQRADTFTVKTSGDDDSIGTTLTNGGSTATAYSVGDTISVTGISSGAKVTVVATYDGNSNVIGEYTVK
jgi:flagellin-like protein